MIRLVKWTTVDPSVDPPPLGDALRPHIEAQKNAAVRAASATAWRLLYDALLEEGLPAGEVTFGEHGKPVFTTGYPCFSLSHSGSLTAVSVSDRPTGVDIERADRAVGERLVERCLTEREKETFDGDFLRLWCRKECIVKLTGAGLYGYPNEIESDDPRFVFIEDIIHYAGSVYRLCAAFQNEI